MAKSTVKITKRFVDGLAYTKGGQDFYWDSELRGFGIVVGQQSKTYIAQRDINGRTRRVTVGRHGVITTDQARQEAREHITQMSKGVDINAKKRERRAQDITLAEAMEMHLEKLRRGEMSDITINDYKITLERYLGDWLKRPLTELTRSLITDRHTRIGTKNGEVTANRTMRAFRAVYNTARKKYEYLPECPTIAIDWYKQERKQEPIPEGKLAEWYEKVKGIDNDVRRDWQVFTLFTGLRKTDASTIKWDDINLDKASLHRPKPKGGKERAFTIPLPDVCVEILKRRQKDNAPFFGKDCPWVFPTRTAKGEVTYIQEPKEYKRGLPSPHRLRDTYTTIANAAGLSPYDIDVLTNHRPPKGSVTAGYIRQDFAYLLTQQQKIADYLKEKIKWQSEKK
jgi:integrase